ncbi:MAG TPA: thiamine pyrophosphate-dependent enzyme [Planctomycetaceae bacterium]|nr:thiamine pyrophosphate-dependent enzyme [Planctomycetaceae bacterium]
MPRMSLVEALKVLRSQRTDEQVILATMGAAREWMKLGMHPLDFIYAPSAMGEAPALGLGMALGQPAKRVIVLNGDGCMLMNLGCLVTITAEAPPNFLLIVCDNSVYEVTGRQWTAASQEARTGGAAVDLCQIARGCGFSAVFEFERIDDWRREAHQVIAKAGPTFVVLKVEPVEGGEVPKSPAPPIERALRFADALQIQRATTQVSIPN